MSNYLLEMRSVTAGYAKDIDVLKDVSLHVKRGEISGLIGLNGAGKSTLIKSICGFLSPKAGEIYYDGKLLNSVLPHNLIDHGICCIPQESSLFPMLTVKENLLLPIQSRSHLFANSWQGRYEGG